MIDYGFLCQAIVDWRAGRRPQMPPPAAPMVAAAGGTAPIELYPSGAPVEVGGEDDVDSDIMEVDEQYDAAASEIEVESAPLENEESESDPVENEESESESESEPVESEPVESEPVENEEVENEEVENEEVARDVEDLDGAPKAPPDYDSTMVYGAGGEMPGQSWSPATDDPDRRDS